MRMTLSLVDAAGSRVHGVARVYKLKRRSLAGLKIKLLWRDWSSLSHAYRMYARCPNVVIYFGNAQLVRRQIQW